MKKVTVTMEKGSDGKYACYVEEDLGHFGLSGYGNTADEAKRDLLDTYHDMIELEAEEGRKVEELKFIYKYDIQSFFNYFNCLNITKVAERAKINPSLMRQYTSGSAKAGQKQYEKLKEAVSELTSELMTATF